MLKTLMIKRQSLLPTYESFQTTLAYEEDQDVNKVNLSSGVYRTEHGEAGVMPCVAKVKQRIVREPHYSHEELNSLGDPEFCKAVVQLLFQDEEELINTDGIFCAQTISSTGALRIAAEVLYNSLNYRIVYTSDPTWENHPSIFQGAGFTDLRKYRYWSSDKNDFDFEGLLEDLSCAPKDSIIIFQLCAHNPTGCDPLIHQWEMIAEVVKTKRLFPIFDACFIGLASGSVETDIKPLQIFATFKLEMMVAVSFGTSLLIYNERVGALIVVSKNRRSIPAIRSHIERTIRGLYGSPASFGMKVVKTILTDSAFSAEWKESLNFMATSMLEFRHSLGQEIQATRTPGVWNYINKTVGMFLWTGLTVRQVEHLVFYYHVYLLKNGRMNICGLTYDNIDYVLKAIRRTMRDFK